MQFKITEFILIPFLVVIANIYNLNLKNLCLDLKQWKYSF